LEDRSTTRSDFDADDTPRAPTLAGFGGVALFTVIFYASGIPRLQDDVLKACYAFRFVQSIG